MTTSLLMSKIIDIGAARRRRERQEDNMNKHDREKRREFRRNSNNRLFVQIVNSDDPDLVGTTISCATIDISASGLRIRTDSLIPASSQLDIWVDNNAGPGKFFLSSEVKWAKIREDGFEVGVELHDGAATDIDQWRQLQR